MITVPVGRRKAINIATKILLCFLFLPPSLHRPSSVLEILPTPPILAYAIQEQALRTRVTEGECTGIVALRVWFRGAMELDGIAQASSLQENYDQQQRPYAPSYDQDPQKESYSSHRTQSLDASAHSLSTQVCGSVPWHPKEESAVTVVDNDEAGRQSIRRIRRGPAFSDAIRQFSARRLSLGRMSVPLWPSPHHPPVHLPSQHVRQRPWRPSSRVGDQVSLSSPSIATSGSGSHERNTVDLHLDISRLRRLPLPIDQEARPIAVMDARSVFVGPRSWPAESVWRVRPPLASVATDHFRSQTKQETRYKERNPSPSQYTTRPIFIAVPLIYSIVAVIGYVRLSTSSDQVDLVTILGCGEDCMGSSHVQDGHARLSLNAVEEDLSQNRIYVSIALLLLALIAAVTLETLVAWSILAYGEIPQNNLFTGMANARLTSISLTDLYPAIAFYAGQADLPDFTVMINSARLRIKRSLRYHLRQALLAIIECLYQLRSFIGEEEADDLDPV
ncbi:hypothetical protein FA13DRAFT_1714961 [Coprinellus micaceus]|uniref:Uncharacterized protein n=1 Tax=Coprinellus micaceus TaxID=71717 RepID=A0A4Y7SS13_COPMI|nr:hypothetical protein FA13DRAFT_1714961 [Coprinellus micaceus]